jgi:hypothetical protein
LATSTFALVETRRLELPASGLFCSAKAIT